MVAEVEALLPGESSSQRSQPSLPVDVLPTVLRNLHDFFCHVAARLEKLHEAVAVQREAYLLRRQQVRTFLKETVSMHQQAEDQSNAFHCT